MKIGTLVRQPKAKFGPNLAISDKVFFSADYSSIGCGQSYLGGCGAATIEQFEISKIASKMAAAEEISCKMTSYWCSLLKTGNFQLICMFRGPDI